MTGPALSASARESVVPKVPTAGKTVEGGLGAGDS